MRGDLPCWFVRSRCHCIRKERVWRDSPRSGVLMDKFDAILGRILDFLAGVGVLAALLAIVAFTS